MRGMVITRGAAFGLLVSYMAVLFAIGYTLKISYDLNHERNVRSSEVNQTLTMACHRENAISKPSRSLFAFVLTFPPGTTKADRLFRAQLMNAVRGLAPVNCTKLPVFNK